MPPKIKVKFKRTSLPKQAWQLVALSVNEKLAEKREIRSLLFDGTSQDVAMQFATPVLPELPNILPTVRTNSTPGGEISFDPLSAHVDDILIRDEDAQSTEDGQQQLWIGQRDVKRKRSPGDSGVDIGSETSNKIHRVSPIAVAEEPCYLPTLPTLPKHVHTLIFDELDAKEVVHLSLTCRRLLSAGASHLLDTVAADLGAWARESVICIGSQAGDGDYPPVIGQDETLNDFIDPDAKKEDHVSLYEYANVFCQRVPVSGFYPVLRDGILLSKAFDDEFYRLPAPVIKDLIPLLYPIRQDYYPDDQVWVLRNLSTREYVLSSGFYLGSCRAPGCGIRRVNFGDIILSRICWSSKQPVEFEDGNGKPTHRGRWAGCRIDITTLEKHEQEYACERAVKIINEGIAAEQQPWIDITVEAKEVLVGVWGQQYGTGTACNHVQQGQKPV